MKKVLSFLAIVATICGTSSIALAKSFKDVKNTKYEEAVDVLSELQVISGYEDGTYKPGNSVKRSEMAKLLIVALGKDSTAQSLIGNTSFSDVTSKHWASGYINLASSMGLIKGYPDGTFRPDATVSYVEASTMLLRALDYGKELDNLSWPTGYMTKANSAGLLKNVTANSSSDSAIRGNVATMILNTLKANKRKVVASNSTGNIYGDGDILLEKSFSNLVYIEKGIVTKLDLDDQYITVEDKENARKVKIFYPEDATIKKLYGREISCIYDEKEEELLCFEIVDKYTLKTVTIDEISDDIIFSDTEEYELPKSSKILLLNISRYEEAEKAYILLGEKNKVEYVTLEGTPTIYAGIITDKDLTLENNKKGIEIRNTTGDFEELILANRSAKVSIGDVILYTIDNDNAIEIQALEDVNDAEVVESASSTSIKLVDESKITFGKTDKYAVYFIDDSYIDPGELDGIESGFDKATIIKFGGTTQILVFPDTVAEQDIVTDVSATTARKSLKKILTTANKKKNKETEYSVVTFEAFRDALTYAQSVYDSSASSAARIQLATKQLNEAYSNLEKATTADKELREAFSKLKTKIAEEEKKVAADYTADSFKGFSTALANAKKITIETTTVAKITTAINNLTSASNLLVTNAASQQIIAATKRLDAAIKDAKGKNQSNYTTESYNEMKKALNAANQVDRTNAGARELNTVASNLEAAIDALVSHEQKAYDDAKAALDKTLKEAKEKKEAAYTEDSWEAFKKDYDEVLESYKKVSSMKTSEVTALNTKLKQAIGKLILKTEDTLKKNSLSTIQKCVTKAKTYANEAAWNETNPAITWEALQTKITNAEKYISEPDKYTAKQMQEMAMDLITYIALD